MIHTILPPEALQPQTPLPASEWIQCPEGWVQAIRGAEGGLTVRSICSTDPAAYRKETLQPGQPFHLP